LGYLSLAEFIGLPSTTFTYWAMKATKFDEMPQYI